MSYKDIVNAKSPKEFIDGFKKKPAAGSLPTAKAKVDEPIELNKEVAFTPSLPQVNVIPFSVFEKYEIKGIARKFVFAGIGIVAVFGLVFAGGLIYQTSQQSKIDALTTQQSQIAAEVQQLQPYSIYKTAVEDKRSALKTPTANDINMGNIYKNINDASGSNSVTISNLSVTQYADGQTSTDCVNPDPFGDNAGIVGCIQFTGNAPDKDAVNGFLDNLQKANNNNGGYKNPFISSFNNDGGAGSGAGASTGTASGSAGGASFTATVAFTNTLYTNQYSDLSMTLKELISSGGNATTNTTEGGN